MALLLRVGAFGDLPDLMVDLVLLLDLVVVIVAVVVVIVAESMFLPVGCYQQSVC